VLADEPNEVEHRGTLNWNFDQHQPGDAPGLAKSGGGIREMLDYVRQDCQIEPPVGERKALGISNLALGQVPQAKLPDRRNAPLGQVDSCQVPVGSLDGQLLQDCSGPGPDLNDFGYL
jgi:hypothetical protein